MSDRELKIRVGASIDASFNTVMASVVDAAKNARKQIASELKAGAKANTDIQKQAGKETSKIFMDEAKAAKTMVDMMKKDVASSAKERVKFERDAMREIERDLKAHNRARVAEAKAAAKEEAKAKGGGGGGGGWGGRFLSPQWNASSLYRAGGSAFNSGKRLAADIARGMGVDLSVGGQMAGATERQHLATNISNSAWISSGAGPKGSEKRVLGGVIQKEASTVGSAVGQTSEDMLKGLEKFVQMTGDLQTARGLMADMGKLSTANGASFEDMMQASAAIANAMGDIEGKGEAVSAVMRTMAGQGQLGAIEIKDMAKNMGYLTAQANNFKIDPLSAKTLAKSGVTNEVAQRVAVEGALAQMARSRGGKTSARQATESANAFMRDLATPSEIKRMQAAGLDTFTDKSHTQVRDPLAMMLEIYEKASNKGANKGASIDVINKLIPNIRSRAVVNAGAQGYNEAITTALQEGKTAIEAHHIALQKVTDEFQKQLSVTQSSREIEIKFAAAMADASSQSKILNNKLGDLAEKAILPLSGVLIALVPLLGTFGEGLLTVLDMVAPGFKKIAEDKKREQEMSGNVGMARTAREEMMASFGKGEISEGANTRAQLGIEALEKEIALKQAETAKLPGGEDWRRKNAKYGQGGHDAELEALDQQKGALQKDLEELKALQSRTSELTSQHVMRVLHEKPLNVNLVSDQTKKDEGGAKPFTSGVSSPDSASH